MTKAVMIHSGIKIERGIDKYGNDTLRIFRNDIERLYVIMSDVNLKLHNSLEKREQEQ